jgi:hypothetical protein
MSAGRLRSTARAAILLAATTLAACAVNSPPSPYGDGLDLSRPEYSDSLSSIDNSAIPDLSDSAAGAGYDRMFLEIHSEVAAGLKELEKTGGNKVRSAEIQSIVKTAEEFYLEGKPLLAIKLLTEAELLLRQVP